MFICLCRRSAASLRRLASACFTTALYIHLYAIFYCYAIRRLCPSSSWRCGRGKPPWAGLDVFHKAATAQKNRRR